MDGLKAILGLSFILLILVGVLLWKKESTPKKPVKVEYKFYNYNF